MRDIRFRAWENGKMHGVGICNCCHTQEDVAHIWGTHGVDDECDDQSDKAIGLQYTGLKDKNGKEIYEGDIISVDQKDFDVFNDEAKYQVKWMGEDGYPAFDLFGWEGECNGLAEVFQSGEYEIKVLGNIYENTELIK